MKMETLNVFPLRNGLSQLGMIQLNFLPRSVSLSSSSFFWSDWASCFLSFKTYFMCMNGLPACVYVYHVCWCCLKWGVWSKRIKMLVNHHVDAGNWALSSENPASTLTVNHFCSPQGFCAWSARLYHSTVFQLGLLLLLLLSLIFILI